MELEVSAESVKASMEVTEAYTTSVESSTTSMEASTTSMEASSTSMEASTRFHGSGVCSLGMFHLFPLKNPIMHQTLWAGCGRSDFFSLIFYFSMFDSTIFS